MLTAKMKQSTVICHLLMIKTCTVPTLKNYWQPWEDSTNRWYFPMHSAFKNKKYNWKIKCYHKRHSYLWINVSTIYFFLVLVLPRQTWSQLSHSTWRHWETPQSTMLGLVYLYLGFSPLILLHNNISMHILCTVFYLFPTVLTRRICLTIKSSIGWW